MIRCIHPWKFSPVPASWSILLGQSVVLQGYLNLASFRESSELEFGADGAFILVPDKKHDDEVILRHLKARHTEPKDVRLACLACISGPPQNRLLHV
ncbi:MAG: hypothetical protein ABSA77_07095 [Thermoguttaceae bacterium]